MPEVRTLPAELWSIDQLAAYLHCARGTLYQQRLRGQAPGALGIETSRRVLYDPAVIAQWLADGGRPDWRPNGG
jgi:hypothetical protein